MDTGHAAVAHKVFADPESALLAALRAQAEASGLLDPALGADPAAVSEGIERLLEERLRPAAASEEECRRYYAAHSAQFVVGERVRSRHILFAVTPGVPVAKLREKAEQVLHALRADPAAFSGQARALSNCPSGALGGDLGWLAAGECAPEFEREIFGRDGLGVLPRLTLSRHGFHIVEVLEREAGNLPDFEEVRGRVAAILARRAYVNEARRFLATVAD